MARNAAVRKAAKAAKRKGVVTAKRKLEIAANSPAARMREAAKLPVLQCLVSTRLFENGIGSVVLARGVSREEQHLAVFMVDTFCLGVKDTYFRTMGRQEAGYILETMQQADPMDAVTPAEARKLLHDVVTWAAGNGFAPHKNHAFAETLFGDVAPAESDYTPRLGHEGKVFYMPGPSETPRQVRRRIEMVRSRFGEEAAATSILALATAVADQMDDEYELEGELVGEED